MHDKLKKGYDHCFRNIPEDKRPSMEDMAEVAAMFGCPHAKNIVVSGRLWNTQSSVTGLMHTFVSVCYYVVSDVNVCLL